MKELQKLLSRLRFAVDKYDMIADGDVIAVGVSGGKDSLALLCALAEMRAFHPRKYEVVALTVDMGFHKSESIAAPQPDYSGIRELCRRLGVPYEIRQSEIARIVFDARKESNPCSLCAMMRRGALHDAALALGANKLALGHHYDDAVETFMMSLIYEGRISCFQPVTDLDRTGIIQIRPMLYIHERTIDSFVTRNGLPVLTNRCPVDKFLQ